MGANLKVQYFGDVHDFRKYVLLRQLAKSGFKIGVCWMLTPDDLREEGEKREDGKKQVDGKKRAYLEHERAIDWRPFDEELYNLLQRTVSNKALSDRGLDAPIIEDLMRVENEGLIKNAVYFNEFLTSHSEQELVKDKKIRRYFIRAADHFWQEKKPDLIFFDPDNGIEVKSCRITHTKAVKFVYLAELYDHYNRGSSLLIYQHFPFKQRDEFIRDTTQKLSDLCKRATVDHFRTPHVAFFAVIREDHKKMFQSTKTWAQENMPRRRNFFWTEGS